MIKYGVRNKLEFQSEEELYFTIGFLAAARYSRVSWERNELSGAWGSEGRILCYSDLEKFPEALRKKFTAGTAGILSRVNCNEFVELLVNRHKFSLNDRGVSQNIDKIRSTIPNKFLSFFDNGLSH